jgi:hypothetical protein
MAMASSRKPSAMRVTGGKLMLSLRSSGYRPCVASGRHRSTVMALRSGIRSLGTPPVSILAAWETVLLVTWFWRSQ